MFVKTTVWFHRSWKKVVCNTRLCFLFGWFFTWIFWSSSSPKWTSAAWWHPTVGSPKRRRRIARHTSAPAQCRLPIGELFENWGWACILIQVFRQADTLLFPSFDPVRYPIQTSAFGWLQKGCGWSCSWSIRPKNIRSYREPLLHHFHRDLKIQRSCSQVIVKTRIITNFSKLEKLREKKLLYHEKFMLCVHNFGLVLKFTK